MALHTFVAGDVLEAQQLNDSFAAVGGGFKYITGATFTSVAAVNVNNCFTSTYRNYAIFYNALGGNNVQMTLRFRASGTDDSNANYNGGAIGRTNGGSNMLWSNSNSTSFIMNNTLLAASTMMMTGSYTFYAPQIAERTSISGTLVGSAGGSSEFGAAVHGGQFTNTTQFDGFSLIISSGTMTGTYRVYGLADS